ncbi:MAG: hypothetical protein FJW36_18535 [Acidobacteria bacterium]|nr:hypothetical protein [Acidobacteriota bacterium]
MKYLILTLALIFCSCQQKAPTQAEATVPKPSNVELSENALKNAAVEVVSARSETIDQSIEAPGKLMSDRAHR